MKQIRAFWEKIKHIWIPSALLLALCLAAGWAWLNDVRPAADNILLERVNEDYTVTTEPLQAGDALILENEPEITLANGVAAEVLVFDLAP